MFFRRVKSKLPLILLILVMVVFAGCGNASTDIENAEDIVAVETIAVVRGDIIEDLDISGKLVADTEANLVPKIPGVVDKISVEIGDIVSEGDTLFTIENSDFLAQLSQAQAGYDLAQAAYGDALKNYERMKTLYDEGAISLSQLEQTKMGLNQANPAVAKAGLTMAQNNYNNTIITSPIDGIVASVNIVEGVIASQQMVAVQVVDTTKVKMQTSVSEQFINLMRLDKEVDVLVAAVSDQHIAGIITAIAPAANAQTMTYPIVITIDNVDGSLKPGMFCEVALEANSVKDILLVPKDAVISSTLGHRVVIIENELAKSIDVEIGMEDDAMIEITSGLTQGDRVCIRGHEQLTDGSKVLERKSEE